MMLYKDLIKTIKKNSYLLPQQYNFKVWLESGVIFNIKLKDELLIKHVSCWIGERGEMQVLDFGVFITLLEIETIMTPLMQKHGMFGGNENSIMLTSTLSELEPELFQRTLNPSYPKIIRTEQDVIDLLNDFNEYTQNVAEPFFKKWSDLRVLDAFLDTVPQMDIADYLGQGATVRKAIVYKLCNNPKFNEYFDWIYNGMVNRYLKNPNGDISYKEWHDLIIDFKEILDKTEPKYNI